MNGWKIFIPELSVCRCLQRKLRQTPTEALLNDHQQLFLCLSVQLGYNERRMKMKSSFIYCLPALLSHFPSARDDQIYSRRSQIHNACTHSSTHHQYTSSPNHANQQLYTNRVLTWQIQFHTCVVSPPHRTLVDVSCPLCFWARQRRSNQNPGK